MRWGRQETVVPAILNRLDLSPNQCVFVKCFRGEMFGWECVYAFRQGIKNPAGPVTKHSQYSTGMTRLLRCPQKIIAGGVFLAVLGLVTCLFAQSDVRLYRELNHIILAVRQLKPGETAPITVLINNQHDALLKWGAGCFVSKDGLMLTANHVVTGGESYFVAGWTNGSFAAVDVRTRDEKLDLALIKITLPEPILWINPPRSEEHTS